MVKRKQVELLGGGFFDPILSLIPLVDKIGQIELCTTYLRSHFGKRPRGLWLPEQVWEASMPNTLKSCGIEYTFLNESAFTSAHIAQEELFYPHLTEEHGKNLTVFPLTLRLKELLFKKTPREVIRYIKRRASVDGERVISILIDGECYARQFVFKKKKPQHNWLKDFFNLLEENKKTITPILPSEYLKTRRIARKVFFSSTFSRTIYRATLPQNCKHRGSIFSAGRKKIDERSGSNFKQIFTKYTDSNLLYSKMMYTHLNVHQMRGDKSRKKSALEELWRGQCHYGYWHGKHLGIYDNMARKEIYRSFINAEKYSRIKGTFLSSIITADFDFDGENELLYQSNELNVYVHLQSGMVFEIDYIPASWNYGDTLTRIREHYHKNGQHSCDPYPRKAFIDHFFKLNKRANPLSLTDRIIELSDSACAKYVLSELKREQRQILFTYNGSIDTGKKKKPFELQKQYVFKKNTIVVSCLIRNTGEKNVAFHFGTEINLSFLSNLKEHLRIFDSSKKTAAEIDIENSERSNVKKVTVEDKLNNVLLEIELIKACSLFTHTLTSHARDNGIIKEQFQGVSFFPFWELQLGPNEVWEGSLELLIQKM
jgi:alpha-amylase